MKRIKYLLIYSFLVSACEQSQQPTENKVQSEISAVFDKVIYHDSLQVELQTMYDTVFSSGYFLHYTLDSNNTIIITWGNKSFQRTIEDESYPGWSPSEFKCEWKNYIGINHSCGSPCWSHFLLPKNEKDSIVSFDYPIAFDTNRNLILYKEGYNGDFIVENIVSRKKRIIMLDSLSCDFFMEGIDSVYFVKKGLYVKWITNQMTIPKERKVKIFELNI